MRLLRYATCGRTKEKVIHRPRFLSGIGPRKRKIRKLRIRNGGIFTKMRMRGRQPENRSREIPQHILNVPPSRWSIQIYFIGGKKGVRIWGETDALIFLPVRALCGMWPEREPVRTSALPKPAPALTSDMRLAIQAAERSESDHEPWTCPSLHSSSPTCDS